MRYEPWGQPRNKLLIASVEKRDGAPSRLRQCPQRYLLGIGTQGAERIHPFPLIPIGYGFLICCHRIFLAFSGVVEHNRGGTGRLRKLDAGTCFSWLERLPVMQEAAGSSPVAPAIFNRAVTRSNDVSPSPQSKPRVTQSEVLYTRYPDIRAQHFPSL
jgi:hypothetical protein